MDMEPLEFIDRLAEKARGAPPVKTDVRAGVLARLRRHKRPWPLAPMWIVAGWMVPAAAAALVAMVLSWGSLKPLLAKKARPGPFDEVIAPFGEMLP